MSSILDFRVLYFCAAYLPANYLRRISTIYLRGYCKGSENGRVVTIGYILINFPTISQLKGKKISKNSLNRQIKEGFSVGTMEKSGETILRREASHLHHIQSTFWF